MVNDFYTVKNWSRFQHYRDRNPPWIKLHWELLSSRDWVMLDDASRVLAVACMLVASRNDGRIPADPAYLRRVAYLHKVPDFKPLIACGFLESASNCKQTLADARPEEETETEEEIEGEGDSKPVSKKVKYLDFVLLLPEEHAKLKALLNGNLDTYIERLNNYLGSKGVKYKSHYHTILAWWRKDNPEAGEKKYAFTT